MNALPALLVLLLACSNANAAAQGSPHATPHPGPTAPQAHPSAYAGFQDRDIKALSDQQVEDLRAGRGMSLALAAELNGYPGPAHVLEWSRELNLSPDQHRATAKLESQMKAEAQRLGQSVIEAERQLDRLFQSGEPTEAKVLAATQEAALAHAKLRSSHLRYHLQMVEILDARQTARYHQLRGYVNVSPPSR